MLGVVTGYQGVSGAVRGIKGVRGVLRLARSIGTQELEGV